MSNDKKTQKHIKRVEFLISLKGKLFSGCITFIGDRKEDNFEEDIAWTLSFDALLEQAEAAIARKCIQMSYKLSISFNGGSPDQHQSRLIGEFTKIIKYGRPPVS